MCRILAVHDPAGIDTAALLPAFAAVARGSREYQGDGWGIAVWNGDWQRYRSVSPIWEDDLSRFGQQTLFVAHARSAFRNEGIAVENNMPFIDGDTAFVFNGELRGVRIAAEGAIGAAKLFGLFRRMNPADDAAWHRGLQVVRARTRYIRAMNFVCAAPGAFTVGSVFNEDPDYFTMSLHQSGSRLMVSSEPLPEINGWTPIANNSVRTYRWE